MRVVLFDTVECILDFGGVGIAVHVFQGAVAA